MVHRRSSSGSGVEVVGDMMCALRQEEGRTLRRSDAVITQSRASRSCCRLYSLWENMLAYSEVYANILEGAVVRYLIW